MSRYDEAQAFVNSCTSYAADVRMQVSLLVAAILGGYHADASQLLVGFCVQVTDFLAFCEHNGTFDKTPADRPWFSGKRRTNLHQDTALIFFVLRIVFDTL